MWRWLMRQRQALWTISQSARHAEFGVSVLKAARGRGYGARLFDRAVMHARNEGRDTYVHPRAD